MKKGIKFIVILLFIGCGSGTFENDTKTWNKVFGEDTPSEVKIINSRFWKSAHWTYEFEVYFKFETDKQFLNQYFIRHYDLILKEETTYNSYLGEKPPWFDVEDFENFDIWVHPEEYVNMKLFKNKKTGIIYLYNSQI